MATWYVHQNGETLGPYSSGEISRWLQEGRIGPDAMCCASGGQDWTPLRQIPEFFPPSPTPQPQAAGQPVAYELDAAELHASDAQDDFLGTSQMPAVRGLAPSGSSYDASPAPSPMPVPLMPAGSATVMAAPEQSGLITGSGMGAVSGSTSQGVALVPALPKAGPRRSGLLVWGLSAAIVVAIGVGSVASFLVLRKPQAQLQLPAPVEELPPNSVMLSSGPARFERPDQGDESIRASQFSALFCGGIDLVDALQRASGKDYAAARAAGLEALQDPAAIRSSLLCGSAIAKAAKGSTVLRITFMDAGRAHRVAAVQTASAVPDIPLLENASFDGVKGRAAKAGKNALERSAALEVAGAWVGGSHESVEAFTRARKAGGGAPAARDTLAKLAGSLRAADVSELRFRPENVDLSLPCALAAPDARLTEFLAACVPESHMANGQLIAVRLKASAVTWDSPESGHAPRFELVLWAREAEDAEFVEQKLKDYAGGLRYMANTHEVELLKMLSAQSSNPRELAWQATSRTWMSAIKKAVVVREGEIVRLKMEYPLAEDDAASLRTATTARGDEQTKAAAAVTAVMDGKPVDAAMLTPFLGANNASWLLASRATEADCQKTTERVNALAAQPGFDDFPLAGDILERWEAGPACQVMRLDQRSRECIAGAKTVRELNDCPVPMSPDAVAMVNALQGTWRPVGVAAASSIQAQGLLPKVLESKLTFSRDKISLIGKYDTLDGAFSVIWIRGGATADDRIAKIRVGENRAELELSFRGPMYTPRTWARQSGSKLLAITTWDAMAGKKRPTAVFEQP